ncbi:hypothetical protein DFR86_10605 [Acidianus sulfidivorans JP7]|uniref:DUF308 domain-containing protein n=1 Tax=Acidianus sulfidivorans JP7 TaxID=619593 RepID=A0A2U9IPG0_9CREN|nr:hypothetical protein [Acidianus sulfidivorans]AWR97939.1 hypothetical protein DFR86_10605 [Acidianus sulfidivorans JP7]
MPRKFKLNPKPYHLLKIAILFLLFYSFAFSFTEFQGIYAYVSSVISSLLILTFGNFANKAFNQMSEEYSLLTKIFPIIIIGPLLYIIGIFLIKIDSILYLLQYAGIILILAYLLEFAMEVMRLGNHFYRKEIKIASYIMVAAALVFVILGVIPYAFLLTISAALLYLGINNILYYLDRQIIKK